jgi:hypothetical protein
MTHLQVILAALAGVAAGPGWRVYVERATAFQRGELPAINIRRRTEANTNRPARPFEALMAAAQVDVDIYWRMSETGPLSGDEIDERVHRAIHADSTLGGLARSVFRIATDWEQSDGDASPARLTIRLEIHYATRAGDIAVQV